MIFALLSFTTEEIWRVFSAQNGALYALTLGLLVGLGAAFLAVRIPREAMRLEREASVDRASAQPPSAPQRRRR